MMNKLLPLLLLVGCSPVVEPTHSLNIDTSDVSVSRIGAFKDQLAYNKERGIYLIEYKGKKFLGVSGIGISELGEHKGGKVAMSDER